MHKLAKGLKKKKKQKKGKKGEEDEEFDPEELERYRRERAEAQQKQAAEAGAASEQDSQPGEGQQQAAVGNDEWRKFQALTSGVDSILKKTQDDLDRIKSTSFFQRKAPEPEPDPEEDPAVQAKKQELAKRYKGFDKDGNPIEEKPEDEENTESKATPLPVREDGLVEVPDDEEEHEDSVEEDIFDTAYVDVLQNIDVQLAYIPDSPTEEELGDDPFDTTNADKVLKTVDKTGKKLVSLGNAVEVLAGRIDYVSTCKIGRNRPRQQQDLLLGDFDAEPPALLESSEQAAAEPVEVEKTLLDDDSDLPDIPVDLTNLPPVLPRPVTPVVANGDNEDKEKEKPLDISEFEILKDKTILDEIPVLDDEEFDLEAPIEAPVLDEADDPFAEKEPEQVDLAEEICFEAATFINEEDPFDTTIADNLLPGKTELKVIEKELEEIPISEVSISLTDPAGLNRDYETGLLKQSQSSLSVAKKDLLGGSVTDLSQLADQPIQPVEEISYVDPFDTSNISELPPGQTELKFLEKELLGDEKRTVTPSVLDVLDDDDFDPRKEDSPPEERKKPPRPPPVGSPARPPPPQLARQDEDLEAQARNANRARKPSRPEALVVSFELPKPDLLASSEEEKTLPAKPLTPYYPQKSLDEVLPVEEEEIEEAEVDPFDTSFVAKTAPGKTELKIIESELLEQQQEPPARGLPHSSSDQELKARVAAGPGNRRQSDFGPVVRSAEVIESLINKRKALDRRQDSILDTDVEVSAEPLAPNVKPSTIEEEIELSYKDPFDTSNASNILPGKAELKLLESELSQLPDPEPIRPHPIIELVARQAAAPSHVDEDPDFDPRADEPPADILCLEVDEQLPAGKVLTPIQDADLPDEDYDPFDTSFASVGPGKTELKLLESELINKMDAKGGNPFLMDDYPAAAEAAMAQPAASNPFLQDFGDASAEAAPAPDVNPFFNFVADQTYQAPATDSTNPFASFGVESAAVPAPESNIFATPEVASVPEPVPTADLFGDVPDIPPAPPATPAPPMQPSPATSPPQAASSPAGAAPGRPARPPPPPRPGPPPPPRNTKDLILSVTGAMDETSNQMLDRLQATRTPSPTLMHSPSPTPEHSFADLLDVDAGVPDLVHDSQAKVEPPAAVNAAQDILGLFDAPASGEAGSPPGAEAGLASGAPPVPSTLSDNPFSDVHEAQPYEPADKRPSLTAGSPAGIPGQLAMDTPPSEASMTDTSAALFGGEAPSSGIDASSFFANAEPAAPASTGGAFADLLGDFGDANTASDITPVSPAPASEFPSSAYRAEDLGTSFAVTTKAIEDTGDAFDAFASKFDKAAEPDSSADPFFDPFGGSGAGQTAMDTSSDVWGDSSSAVTAEPVTGFEEGDGFDSFLSMTAPPPEVTAKRRDSADSDEGPDFSVFIKPKEGDQSAPMEGGPVPVLAPPPKSPMSTAYADTSPRFNPFDKSQGFAQEAVLPTDAAVPELTRTDSQETPPTPLFDEDVSQPLEDFPRVHYTGDGWEMHLRQPIKKKITGQRFWKKIFIKLVYQGDSPVLQLYNNKGDKDPFQELPLLACYSVSDIAAQQFDQYGKIFTVKLQYIIYKERPGVRPGQVTKAERITNKLSQFAAYAIQGDYQGVKEFGSDLKKLGLPVEHAPQISQLFKLGSQVFEDMKAFSCAVEEALFRLQAHRDRALQYKMEEVQITVVDELYVEQNADGHVEKQIARVRLFFLGFLSGMPDVELGINDIWRQGKEVVGRHDIIPVATEEWIRLENVEFHSCVQQDEYEKSRIIKFKPPDACYIELMRFRVRPPRNRELPLQLKAVMCVTGNKVELRADILVPGFASRKLGRVPCEDVMVRFPIPECWIYLFRVEKHFRYGSVKSAHRRTGKIKGIERILGAVDTLDPQLMEVTSGQAKYEHQHHAIVWRMPRLPKEGQGAYTTHQLVCKMNLTSYDQIPEKLSEFAYVEFTMPVTQVSHTTARSVSFQNYDSDEPPEKYVRNLSRHEYRVGIEHTQGDGPGAYVSATSVAKKPIPESGGESHDEATDHAASDSDSSD